MMPFGPQAGSGFMSPTPQQPQGGDPMAAWSMQNQAQQDALVHAMHGMLNQQNQGNYQQAGMLGAQQINHAFGNPIGQVLHPLGQAIQSGARSLVGAAPAAQSYTVGGATTIGSESARQAGLTAAPTATLDSSAPSLGASVAPILSLAGSAYGAYSGIERANAATGSLHQAISYGVSPEIEQELRQRSFDTGMKSAGIGGLAGLAGGAASGGPIGAIPGAVLGMAPGVVQAWNSEPDNKSRFQAQVQFQENPFR